MNDSILGGGQEVEVMESLWSQGSQDLVTVATRVKPRFQSSTVAHRFTATGDNRVACLNTAGFVQKVCCTLQPLFLQIIATARHSARVYKNNHHYQESTEVRHKSTHIVQFVMA